MDALCLKVGIHGMAPAGNVDLRPTPPRNLAWGFSFRHPLRSLWPGSKIRLEPSIAVDDAVLAEQKEEIRAELGENSCGENEECAVCDEDDDENMEFNRATFSKLLRKVPVAESRLYAKLCYLGSLAYSIPQIKAGNLLKYQGLQFVTSSLEKKSKEDETEEEEEEEVVVVKGEGNHRISSTAAYQIAASAASYFHSRTKSILSFNSSKSMPNGEEEEDIDTMKEDVASLIATTDKMTAVVSAEEDVKQAVADDLNSTLSSPCQWFICDHHQTATRFFVIQGSESLSSWKANLLFEPIQFEGLDVVVHRGIYEAAKGMYEQMLPEIEAHLKYHGDAARFRFTGHSLGGSLSVLLNLMLLIRNGAPRSSLLPVITYGAPSIMCGGDRLLRHLGLPRNHVRSITMHRDIVPRAFSCNYPSHVAQFLKAINGNFRNLPCLTKQKLLYSPMGELLILQPDHRFSPNHQLLPPGAGLYVVKQNRAAQTVFLNSPHPLEILSDRAAYGSQGTVQRDHDMNSYLKSIRNVIRQDLIRNRKVRRDRHRKVWWPSRPVSDVVRSWRRFSTLVASQHMHLLVVLLFPARLLVLGSGSFITK